MHPNLPNRRSVIKHMAIACGLILSSSSLNSLATILGNPADLSRRKAGLLNANQLIMLREISEVIIPTTDTPGAIAAGVHEFINQFAMGCLNKKEQQQLILGVEKISTQSNPLYQKTFETLSLSQKIELLTRMEKAESPFDSTDRTNIKYIKGLVTFAYYTSEIGASQELAYLTIPGGYKGNFKFKGVGKAWALSQ